jgi:hypothetical protein
VRINTTRDAAKRWDVVLMKPWSQEQSLPNDPKVSLQSVDVLEDTQSTRQHLEGLNGRRERQSTPRQASLKPWDNWASRLAVSDEHQLEGETFHTVIGTLKGIYTWECDHVPSEEYVHTAMNLRVQADCRQLRRHPRRTELAGWHGSWTSEGIGIFAADIWGVSRVGSSRRLGGASVVVRTPLDQGSRTWDRMAC